MQLHTIKTQFRQWMKQSAIYLLAIAAAVLLSASPSAAAAPQITVYRDAACRCCEGWMESLAAEGFQTRSIPTDKLEEVKQQQGVPDSLTSCHTAVIDGYVIEGHVPASDIKRLLTERPNIAGITVPGMPIGTPGMESDGKRDDFTVFSFDRQGETAAFSEYAF